MVIVKVKVVLFVIVIVLVIVDLFVIVKVNLFLGLAASYRKVRSWCGVSAELDRSQRGVKLVVSDMEYVFNRVDSAVVLESKILVIQNHPILALLTVETLYVGEHTNWHHNHTTICQIHRHHPSFLSKIEFLDSKICVLILAHD